MTSPNTLESHIYPPVTFSGRGICSRLLAFAFHFQLRALIVEMMQLRENPAKGTREIITATFGEASLALGFMG